MAGQSSKKPNADFNLKAISPSIGARTATSHVGITSATDLVETTLFLYVRIVRAEDLPGIRGPNTCDPYVEVKVGGLKMTTTCFSRNSNPEWNQVFALEKARIQEPTLEILVKDKIPKFGEILGRLSFAISEIPTRVPTDSSLASQWYWLEDQKGISLGKLMLSNWIGTQADEAFPEARHLESAIVNTYNVLNTRSQIYLSPRIWCLRINLIQAQDLVDEDRVGDSQIFVQAALGSLTSRSKLVNNNKGNPKWNEEMFFAVLEPFDQQLFLSVEQGTMNNHRSIGKCKVPVKNADKRLDGATPAAKWYNLERPNITEVENNARAISRLNMRLSLDGGYHIFDEDPCFSSDLNPTIRRLWRSSVGIFELGILNASGLPAMKIGSRTDAYCVAKYGPKWVRTRTVIDNLNPKWNEQYTWDVYDPCTSITIAVFDNGYLHEVQGDHRGIDARIGKVRINLSEMITNRIYTYSFPLAELQPSGLKKMGEIQLAFRFCCPDMANLLKIYLIPKLPRLHFSNPLSRTQLSGLRKQTIMLLSSRMSKTEPAWRREVVSYMLDSNESLWSMRRGRADFDRIKAVMSGFVALHAQYDKICQWKNPTSSLIVCLIIFVLILEPQILLPGILFCLMLDIILQYPKRPGLLSHVDLQLSHVNAASVDELEEEFDPVPSKFEDRIIRYRYDRLRIILGRLAAEMGKLATRIEKLQSFLTWQDPTATFLFMILCLIGGIVTLFIPFQLVISICVLYLLRHPRFRSPIPALFENWVSRMPSKLDSMI
ncbi:FT-interacting protein 3-like [Neltuma alba]|uniref:FT-interacting protein 3-like n=1 Tax=Neltuma alba TaxID=207710 RepID=UPI0010A49749|nr:FT-interacting protein 3-like [Prosopis alba]